MRILLMSPLMKYEDRWGQYHKGAGDTFPIGIGSIAGYLEEYGHEVDVVEPDINKIDHKGLVEIVKINGYKLIGISAFTTNIVHAYKTADSLKSAFPDIKIVIGGAHATLFPELTLKECPSIDYLITNEGEVPLRDLIEVLDGSGSIKRIPNLYYRKGSEICFTNQQVEWLNLDDLPVFPYHKFDYNLYTPAPSLRKKLPTFSYMAQRGCPYQCSFCDTRTHGRRVRYRSVNKVLEDLAFLKSNYNVKGIIFEGSNFTANAGWVSELCEGLIERNLNLSWYCMGRVDFNVELIPLMKRAGLWCMSFGIESANSQTLQRMKKKVTSIQVKSTLEILKKNKIITTGSFILGYPGETKDDVLNTIKFSCDLPLDIAVYFIPVPFPGTKLYNDAIEFGGLKKKIEWKHYSAWLDHNSPIYENPLLDGQHTMLYNTAYRRFYTRPGYLIRQLMNLRSPQDILKVFKGFSSVSGLIRKGFK